MFSSAVTDFFESNRDGLTSKRTSQRTSQRSQDHPSVGETPKTKQEEVHGPGGMYIFETTNVHRSEPESPSCISGPASGASIEAPQSPRADEGSSVSRVTIRSEFSLATLEISAERSVVTTPRTSSFFQLPASADAVTRELIDDGATTSSFFQLPASADAVTRELIDDGATTEGRSCSAGDHTSVSSCRNARGAAAECLDDIEITNAMDKASFQPISLDSIPACAPNSGFAQELALIGGIDFHEVEFRTTQDDTCLRAGDEPENNPKSFSSAGLEEGSDTDKNTFDTGSQPPLSPPVNEVEYAEIRSEDENIEVVIHAEQDVPSDKSQVSAHSSLPEQRGGAQNRRGRSCPRIRCPCKCRGAGAVKCCDSDDDVDETYIQILGMTTLPQRFIQAFAIKIFATCPFVCGVFGSMALCGSIGCGLIFALPTFSTDFGAFYETDVNTSIMDKIFSAASNAREDPVSRRLGAFNNVFGREFAPGHRQAKEDKPTLSEDATSNTTIATERRLWGELFYDKTVCLAYELIRDSSDTSLLDIDVLSKIAWLESQIRSVDGWHSLCEASQLEDRTQCNPGLSFVNWALPSMVTPAAEVVPKKLVFDGGGHELLPLETTYKILEEEDLTNLVFPTGHQTDQKPYYLRSCFRFKFLVGTGADDGAFLDANSRMFGNRFEKMMDALLPLLQTVYDGDVPGYDEDMEEERWPLKVYYEGTGIQQREMWLTLMADIKLATGSALFVLFYLVAHTQSIFLSGFGMLLAFSGIPAASLVFSLVTGSTHVHVANLLALFLVIGLGSDNVFIFADTWRNSEIWVPSGVKPLAKNMVKTRLVWTFQKSTQTSMATALTTSVAFLANLASVLRSLREFGFFIGVCILLSWFFIVLFFLPLCYISDLYFHRCRNRCIRRLLKRVSNWVTEKVASILPRFRWPVAPEPMHSPRSSLNLRMWSQIVIGVSCVLFLGFCIPSIFLFETETGAPGLYPKDHNQNAGNEVFEKFGELEHVYGILELGPKRQEQVCKETQKNPSSCNVFWCDATIRELSDGGATCKCSRRKTYCNFGSEEQNNPRVFDLRIVLPAKAKPTTTIVSQILGAGDAEYNHELAPLVMQEWETGATAIGNFHRVTGLLPTDSTEHCSLEEVCYCDEFACKTPPGYVDDAGNIPIKARRLQQYDVVTNSRVQYGLRAWVSVVFGIIVDVDTKLLGQVDWNNGWRFNSIFEIRHHWAQRNLLKFCQDLTPNLRVTLSHCFMQEFRDYVVNQVPRQRFPSNDMFEDLMNRFLTHGIIGEYKATKFVWVRDGKVVALYSDFQIDVSTKSNVATAMKHKGRWDTYSKLWNMEAQVMARGAWHTSRLWVQAQGQVELIRSLFTTIAIVVILSAFGMVCFTRDAVLSLFVILSSVFVVAGLFFFIIVVMQFPIGPIEVIALIVFIGYAITYPLHVAHVYGSEDAIVEETVRDARNDARINRRLAGPKVDLHTFTDLQPKGDLDRHEIRAMRVKHAFHCIGSASIGSAVTSSGCALFLLFCTLTMFKKIGAVVLAVTFLSISTAYGPLAALLYMIGPINPGCKCRNVKEALSGLADIQKQFAEIWDMGEDENDPNRRSSVGSVGPAAVGPRSALGVGQVQIDSPAGLDEDNRGKFGQKPVQASGAVARPAAGNSIEELGIVSDHVPITVATPSQIQSDQVSDIALNSPDTGQFGRVTPTWDFSERTPPLDVGDRFSFQSVASSAASGIADKSAEKSHSEDFSIGTEIPLQQVPI